MGFSPAGKFLCAPNYLDSDISILTVEGAQLIDTGNRVALPGCSVAMASIAAFNIVIAAVLACLALRVKGESCC